MSSLMNNEELLKHIDILINGAHEVFKQEEARQKWLIFLQKYQQLYSDLDKARREIASLDQKLCHARRNLDEEKRKRRIVEHHEDLLENQINIVRDVLFHDKEVNLEEGIKRKLHFLNKPTVKSKLNNLNVRDTQSNGRPNTITELDSTGSILSDLNCLSKSEDDLDTNAIIKDQKQREWKEHKPSCEYSVCKRHSTLDKVAEFNSSVITTPTMTVKPHDEAFPRIEITSVKDNLDRKFIHTKASASHSFVSKIVIKPETCTACGKRIRFGKIVLKCKDCPTMCHTECKTIDLFPCVRGKTTMLCSFLPKK